MSCVYDRNCGTFPDSPDSEYLASTQRCYTGAGGRAGIAQQQRRQIERYVRPRNAAEELGFTTRPGMRLQKQVRFQNEYQQRLVTGFDKSTPGRANIGGRNYDQAADANSGHRFAEYHLRQLQRDGNTKMQEHSSWHAPYGHDRILAMQYDPTMAEEKRIMTRRKQPTIIQSIDHGMVAPYINNPYTQPLPNPGAYCEDVREFAPGHSGQLAGLN